MLTFPSGSVSGGDFGSACFLSSALDYMRMLKRQSEWRFRMMGSRTEHPSPGCSALCDSHSPPRLNHLAMNMSQSLRIAAISADYCGPSSALACFCYSLSTGLERERLKQLSRPKSEVRVH